MKAKVSILAKPHPLHLFHTAVRQCMGVFVKRTTNSLLYWQFMAVVSFSGHFLAPPLERGYKFTNFTAVASFSGYFLAPPTWPGNKATSLPTLLL